jgi:urease accessory protein
MKNANVAARNRKQVGNSSDLRKNFQQEETEGTDGRVSNRREQRERRRIFSKTLFSLLPPVESLLHILPCFILFAPARAFAHVQGAEALGFFSGLAHPVSGPDHVLAMIAVGLWGAQLGAPAIWVLPIAFPLVMAAGGMLGLIGVSIPGIEYGIAASAILLGTAVAFEVRPSIVIAALLVGVFAIFHGHAHGTELPPGQSALLYSIGFVIATGCLHGLGIGVGAVHQWAWGQKLLRTAGAAVAVGGVFFMWRALV